MVNKVGKIENQFRTFAIEFLAGEENLEVQNLVSFNSFLNFFQFLLFFVFSLCESFLKKSGINSIFIFQIFIINCFLRMKVDVCSISISHKFTGIPAFKRSTTDW